MGAGEGSVAGTKGTSATGRAAGLGMDTATVSITGAKTLVTTSGSGVGLGSGIATGLGAGADSGLPVSMRANTAPIGTTSFTPNKISAILPAAVEGTSLSTLSVAISSTVSSNCTTSPTCLCHFRIVASIMLSPNLGMIKSTRAIANVEKYE